MPLKQGVLSLSRYSVSHELNITFINIVKGIIKSASIYLYHCP